MLLLGGVGSKEAAIGGFERWNGQRGEGRCVGVVLASVAISFMGMVRWCWRCAPSLAGLDSGLGRQLGFHTSYAHTAHTASSSSSTGLRASSELRAA